MIPKFYFQSSLLNNFLLTYIQSPFTDLISPCFGFPLLFRVSQLTHVGQANSFNQYFMYWIEKI